MLTFNEAVNALKINPSLCMISVYNSQRLVVKDGNLVDANGDTFVGPDAISCWWRIEKV